MSIYTLMPLHLCLGLAVVGVDLSQPVDSETAENLRRLLAQHLVLVFPAQNLTPEQYLDAAAIFGPPIPQLDATEQLPGHPGIGLDRQSGGDGAPEGWHTAHPERERPPAATILYAVEIPSAGGGTSIADMRAAYWLLPDEERGRLETLRTVNRRDGGTDAAIVHPMVRTHPVSRERAVYFHPTQTDHIEGMSSADSRAYFADLVERMIQPEIVYRHDWVKGDVLVIDDRASLRRAHDDYDHSESRLMWRILVEGERPALV
jgi:taurine dioxygenase